MSKRTVRLIGGLLLLSALCCASPADAYQLLGPRWPAPTTSFFVNIPGADGLWNRSFEQAMYYWSDDTIFKYTLVRGVYEDPCDSPEGRNGVAFVSNICGDAWGAKTLAMTQYWRIGSTLTQADILFNSNESWNVYSTPWRSGVSDFQRVAVHELGHALGLDHEDSGVATIMKTYAGDITVPQQDDIDGVAALYGPGNTYACTYALSAPGASYPAAGGSGSISVSASDSRCVWTAGSNAPSWITLAFGSNGTGNGTVGYEVAANPGASRSGNITVATQIFTINQAAEVFEGVFPLPQTGQTLCHDAGGAVIPCAGTGQDGELRAGVPWPGPRFTDNGDQTVTDNLTGLVWARNGNLMKARDPGFDGDPPAGDGRVTWQRALDYVKKLNHEHYLGHNDWRLPNVTEMESLVHIGQANAAAWLNSETFVDVQADYWSSSTQAGYGAESWAWHVSLVPGRVHGSRKSDTRHVWPVRAGQPGSSGPAVISLPRTGQTLCYDESGAVIACAGTGQDGELQMGAVWPATWFTDNGDQTVTDNATGLVWTRDAKTPGPSTCGPGVYKTWQGALDYVKCLNRNRYLGYDDWRLPNRREQRSLAHIGQANAAAWLNSRNFVNVQSYYYWSSGTVAGDTGSAWGVPLDGVFDYPKSNDFHVWPVRAGRFIPYLDLVQKIYIGYYQRPADPAGLIYWADRLDRSGGNLIEIIEAFAHSAESRALYGTLSSSNIATVVNDIYLTLFGRPAETGGLNWYVNGFNAGTYSAATIMLNVLSGARNEDLASVNNKLAAANLFTRTIDPELDGLNFRVTYAGDGDVIAARNFLTLYATAVKVPTQAEVTAYIKSNIADPGDAVNAR